MSNYSVITDWDGKDALADSNPAKVISGDEFQDEFDAIATAVATKADINGNASESFAVNNLTVAGTTTLTGTATGPTPSAGDDSTNLATTAYVQDEIGTLANNASVTYTVSTSAPSGGSDGDILYRY